MRKFLTVSITAISVLVIKSDFTYSQQITPKIIQVHPVKVVNFSALADYQQSHPVKHRKRYVEQGEDRENGVKFKPRVAPANTPVFTIPASPRGSSAGNSPAPVISFNGTISNGTLFPPDINGAIGDNYIVESTNQEYDIYTKTGGLVKTLDIGNFFASQNIYYPYDPHVEYDDAHKRYILISDGFQNISNTEGPSEIFVAVSQTADPRGAWYTYSFNGYVVNTSDFLDYPLLGYNNNWVVITGNDYLSSGGTQVNVWVLNRADLYGGTLGTVKEFSLANYISITPTQTYDTTVTQDYLIQDYNGNQGGKGYVQIGSVSGTLNNPTVSAGNTLGETTPWNDNSAGLGATQLGSTQTIESGLTTEIENSVYRNGSLWFAQTVYLPVVTPTHSAIDWWQVNPTAFAVTQFGRIEDPNGVIDYYYPGINVNANNDVLIGYTTSSPSIYASSGYAYHSASDAKNSIENGYTYKNGQASYALLGDNRNRWGDFSFTSIDPSDSSFWTFQEFAATPANTWGTVIANVKGEPCTGLPTAGSITSSIDTPCNGEGVVLTLNGYSSNGTGVGILWQQSTNGINGWKTPTAGTGDSTSAYSTAPITGTTYYRAFVRCNNSKLADTSAPIKIVSPGVISTSLSADNFCTPQTITLTANAVGAPVNWYVSNTSVTPISTGNTLNAYVYKDTTFYVNTGKKISHTLGLADNSGNGGYFNYSYDDGLSFTALDNFTLDSVYVYADSSGNVTVNLVNGNSGTTVARVSVFITAAEAGQKTVVHTNFNCTGGVSYQLTATGTTVDALFRDAGDAVYPYTVPNVVSITGANNGAAGYYYFFYDWHVSSGCVSNRVPVPVNFTGLALTATASPSSICEDGSDSVLLTVSGSATSYQWSPGSSTSNSFHVKPTVTTTYTVTGTNGSGCGGATTVTVNVRNCAGINSVSSNNPDMEIYPNPTSGDFDVILTNLPEQKYAISLYDILGQKDMEQDVTITSSKFVLPMDVSIFPAGVYFIRLVAGDQELTQRITKQ